MSIPADCLSSTISDSFYRFGACEVNPHLRQVTFAGRVLDAQPKTFDLLLYLIENRDRVVDKQELLDRLWPGTVVTESALTQVVRKARALAGDDGDRQAVIKTVQRRGFRFVAALQTGAPTGATRASRLAVRSPDTSLAVLPFVDMSPEQDQEYFCDGMAEEITNRLTRVPGLRVAARTSTFAFKNRADDVRDIGRQLGVRSVLEGSVRKWRDRFRVTAQLIDADSGFHIWSERWDRSREDVLEIQEEIAQLIASMAAPRRGTESGSSGPRSRTPHQNRS
jgi:TolB-like protein